MERMKTMKKLMAMVLTIAMVMSMVFVVPASAEETFTVSGIEDGVTYFLGSADTPTVTVTPPTDLNVTKVQFVIDGVVYTTDVEAPFTWTLPNYGGTHELTFKYQIDGSEAWPIVEGINYTYNAIAVSGIADGMMYVLNDADTAPTVTVTPVEDYIKKVVFSVDGTVVGEATEAPFEWPLPTAVTEENMGPHELKIEVIDINDTHSIVGTYSYTAIIGLIEDEYFDDYESGLKQTYTAGTNFKSATNVSTKTPYIDYVEADPKIGDAINSNMLIFESSGGTTGTAEVHLLPADTLSSDYDIAIIEFDVAKETDTRLSLRASESNKINGNLNHTLEQGTGPTWGGDVAFPKSRIQIVYDNRPATKTVAFYITGPDGVKKLDKSRNLTTAVPTNVEIIYELVGKTGTKVMIDNLSVKSYTVYDEIPEASYEVSGLTSGDEYIIGVDTPPTVELETTALDVGKVEFVVGDDVAGEVTSVPYSWTLPNVASHVGTHSLTIKVYDSAGNVIKTLDPITYKAIYGKVGVNYFDDFEGAAPVYTEGTSYKNTQATVSAGAILPSIKNVNAQGMSGNALCLTSTGKGALTSSALLTPTDLLPESYDLAVFEFDLASTGSTAVDIRASKGAVTAGTLNHQLTDPTNLATTSYVAISKSHFRIVIDKSKTVSVYITGANGVETLNRSRTLTVFPTNLKIFYDYTSANKEVMIDNLSVKSFDLLEELPEEVDYAFHGIAEGEVIIAGEEEGRTVAVMDADAVSTTNPTWFQSTNPTALAEPTLFGSATFTLDNVVLDTVDGKPYAAVLPTDEIGEHTLVVRATDAFGRAYTIGTYNYVVTNGKYIGGQPLNNFDNEVVATDGKSTTNAVIYSGANMALDAVNVAPSGETVNKMLKLYVPDTNASGTINAYLAFVPNKGKSVPLTGGTAKMIYVDFDVYHVGKGQSLFGLGQNTDKGVTGTFGSANNAHSFNAVKAVTAGSANDPANTSGYTGLDEDALVHITAKYDIANNEVVVYLDGYEWYRGATTSATLPSSEYYFRMYSIFDASTQLGSARYIDNFKVSAYDYDLDVAWDGPTITSIAGSNTMRVYNPTATPYTLLNICAGYDANDVLVDAVAGTVEVEAYDSNSATYDMSAFTGATTYKMFTWDAISNYPYIIPAE